MSNRGLWIMLACTALDLTAFQFAPDPLAFPAVTASILGGWVGGAIFARDYYRYIKQYERERDEFNQKLTDRG